MKRKASFPFAFHSAFIIFATKTLQFLHRMMKKIFLALVLLAGTMGMSAQGTKIKKKGDPIRQQITWQAPAAPSNEDGEIEKLYLAYNTPDGQEHQIICELPWPVEADQFVGGDMEEEDINFDGIPDLQVFIGYTNATGHNAIYNWYVWDTTLHSFIEVEEPLIISPHINREDKTITTRMIIDDTASFEEYQWKEGKLVKTHEWSDDLNSLYDE